MAIRARGGRGRRARVTLTHPRRAPLTVDPDDARGRRAADRLGDAALPTPTARARPSWCARDRGMTDSDFPSISILNRASLAALGERLGKPLAMERFRGNVWLDGLEPFAEFDLVGRDLRLGEAEPAGARAHHPLQGHHASIPLPASATPTPSARCARAGTTRTSGSMPRSSPAAASPWATRPRREAGLHARARARRRGAGARPQALRRPLRLPEGRRRHGRPAARRPGGGLLRRPLERRQVHADQRADRPQGAGTRLQHPRAAPRRSTSSRSARRYYLVDLPGYGFAEAPKPVVERWQALLRAYLAGRPTLRRAFLLIDARHGIKAVDAEIMAAARPLRRHLPGGADQGRQARAPRALAATIDRRRRGPRPPPGGLPRDRRRPPPRPASTSAPRGHPLARASTVARSACLAYRRFACGIRSTARQNLVCSGTMGLMNPASRAIASAWSSAPWVVNGPM